MKSLALMLVAASAVLVSGQAQADEALAKSKNCLACHAAATKLVGPSYKDVAAKYAGQKDAVAKLSEKIIKGSSGTWGAVPMPANTNVSPDEAKKLAAWVLSVK